MVSVGYTLLCEQSGPKELVDHAVRAEAAGFDQLVISDHYYPWLDSQGHSPYAWSVLGAVAHATSRAELMSFVTCPIRRYHPAVVAQKASTVGLLSDGRFTLGLGAGENLNEHVAGEWPHVQQRHEMFEEALQIIRPLLNGETLTFSGNHFDVPDAYVWDRPETPVRMAVAASGPQSASLAAEYGDGLIATEPDPQIIQLYEDAGGGDRNRYGQLAICYGPDEAECRRIAHEQFRWFGLGWRVMPDLPNPGSFAAATQFVREEDVARGITCGPDVDRHVEAFRAFVEAGFTHVALLQVGADRQPMFLDWAQEQLLPRLREL
ncbi:TIGR03557 family F420-dependent LLM class oxidoreductase [Micromonospora sp. 15K316]|uniref:TIGR03557 family F420-dependent LLM class oxidoreductase n=1 Tax=Micromonospora sp. 15K316 TaxID=2530376 RepID=UPI001047F21F|nr:TIGR03557 family F420-dependent LLM class oxidoreductase [Micromonospora sp. 15K316]TDC39285.1 TIGR03557 family F420-dependent LLM class oxidoreductase [Micromonospora sp. 15K316]